IIRVMTIFWDRIYRIKCLSTRRSLVPNMHTEILKKLLIMAITKQLKQGKKSTIQELLSLQLEPSTKSWAFQEKKNLQDVECLTVPYVTGHSLNSSILL